MIDNKTQKMLRDEYNPDGSELRSLQLEMLAILKQFDEICKRHNISYWLDGGTLLGAIRHGGFIPWDDDLDVAMKHEDYNKIKRILQKELKHPLYFQSIETDNGYILPFVKIRNEQIPITERDSYDIFYKFKGIYIDIFSLDYNWYFLNRITSQITQRFRPNSSRSKSLNSIFNRMGHYILPIINKFLKLISKVYKSSYLTYDYGVAWPVKLTQNDIFPLKEIEFENTLFPIPNNWEKLLIQNYGDYMKIPLKKERMTHLVKNN